MRAAVSEVVSSKTRILAAVAESLASEISSWIRTSMAQTKTKTREEAQPVAQAQPVEQAQTVEQAQHQGSDGEDPEGEVVTDDSLPDLEEETPSPTPPSLRARRSSCTDAASAQTSPGDASDTYEPYEPPPRYSEPTAAPAAVPVPHPAPRLRSGAAAALAAALGRGSLQQLETLKLGRNRIGDEGMIALAPPLRRLRGLQELHVYSNKIGDTGVEALLADLGDDQLTQLKVLNFADNLIYDAGCAMFIAALDGYAYALPPPGPPSCDEVGGVSSQPLEKRAGSARSYCRCCLRLRCCDLRIDTNPGVREAAKSEALRRALQCRPPTPPRRPPSASALRMDRLKLD